MASTIISCSEFLTSDIKMYPPKPSNGGGKNVGMMHKRTNTGIRIQLPIMFTYGANDYEGNKNYSCGLQFPDLLDESVSPEYHACLEKLIAFETFLKQKVLENSKEWTQKQMKGIEMVDMIWTPMLRYPMKADKSDKDYTKSPTLNVKIPCWDSKWSSEIYDEEGICLFSAEQGIGESPLPFITKGTNMAAIIQCGGLWIVSGKIGVTWKLMQTVVKQSSTSVVGKCLIKIKETDKTSLHATVDLSKHPNPDHIDTEKASERLLKIDTNVVDSDQEEDDEDDATDDAGGMDDMEQDFNLTPTQSLASLLPPIPPLIPTKASTTKKTTKRAAGASK